MRRFNVLIIFTVCLPALATGVLNVHPDNPRWFADESGRAIYLGGEAVGDPPQTLWDGNA